MEEPEITMPEESKFNFSDFIKTRNGKIVIGVAVGLVLCACCVVVVSGIIVIAGNIQPTQFGF